jgi:hypothetical protein
MATLYLVPISLIPQWLNNIGVMAAGGQLNLYVSGTTTPATTYTDSTGLVANPNPMTLSSTGRAASASGAPVAFWVASGTVLDLLVYDSGGNPLQSLKGITALNDPLAASTSLQNSLANPASSNGAGAGPVAGVDLVANALKSYDVFADVRAANAPILAAGQTLNIQVQGGQTVNDGYGGDFYWNATSSAADNNTTVLKPTSVTGAGRWLRLYTPPYGAQNTIASAATTDLGTLGSNIVQITGSGTITSLGASASTSRPLWFLNFNGAATLTYNAVSLILPGTQNILTAPGDSALAQYLGSGNWQILAYNRASTLQSSSQIALVTADQSLTSQTSPQPVTQLVSSTLGIGSYLVQLRLLFAATTTVGMGYTVNYTFSGTAATGPYGTGVQTSNGTPSLVACALGGSVSVSNCALAPAADGFQLDVILQVTAPGVVQVKFAQDVSSGNPLAIKAGSSMIIIPL